MALKDNKLKNGLNKFSVDDLVIYEHRYRYRIKKIYNDFSYLMEGLDGRDFQKKLILTDDGFTIMPLIRVIILGKWEKYQNK